jgi:hypothetical protein
VTARVAAVVLAVGGLIVLAYGLFGGWVVFRDWLPCVNPGAVGIGDKPAGYCELTDWRVEFGIGLGLILAGLVGIGLAARLVRRGNGRSPARAR